MVVEWQRQLNLLNGDITANEYSKQHIVWQKEASIAISFGGKYTANISKSAVSQQQTDEDYECMFDLYNKADPANVCLQTLLTDMSNSVIKEACDEWYNVKSFSLAILDMIPVVANKDDLDDFMAKFASDHKVSLNMVQTFGFLLLSSRVVY